MEKQDNQISVNEEVIKEINNRIDKIQKKLKKKTDKNKKREFEKEVHNLITQKGALYLEQKDFEKAMELYESLPCNTHAEDRYLGITRILMETQKYGDAQKLLKEALSKFPNSYYLYNSMGLLFYRTENYYEALRYYDLALTINSEDNIWSLYNKALTLNVLKYYEEAYKILTDLIQKAPHDPEYIIEMAYCNLQRKDYLSAIYFYRTAAKMRYESPGIYGGLCCAYGEAGFINEAYRIAMAGINRYPDEYPGLYENLAEVCLELGDFNNAYDVIKKGLSIDPDYLPLKELLKEVEGGRSKE